MVAGSFFLTPATAIRYERHDRRVRQVSKEEELGIGKDRRKVDINEEYYRLAARLINAEKTTPKPESMNAVDPKAYTLQVRNRSPVRAAHESMREILGW
ncbi:Cytochrome oxidase assembly [Peltigera leucophlebia]|nr:Cytochrome oxidase assembly [Peltigera leucophlebia]